MELEEFKNWAEELERRFDTRLDVFERRLATLGEQVETIEALTRETLEERIGKLGEQIEAIEALTRESLPNFPDIFRKAKRMLEGSSKKFWMLNFTPAFGRVHAFDKFQLEEYWKIGKRRTLPLKPTNLPVAHTEWIDEVNEFTQLLVKKARKVDDFRLATVESEVFRDGFLNDTVDKMQAALLNQLDPHKNATNQMINDFRRQLHNNHVHYLNEIMRACRNFNESLQADHGQAPALENVRGVFLMRRIPIQLFIADIEESSKRACLVFFIGDFNTKVERRISGFYTEQAPLVTLFEGIFKNNVDHFGTIQLAKRNADPVS